MPQDIAAFFSGLVVAVDYGVGQATLEDRDFAANADFFREIFELARRYKVLTSAVSVFYLLTTHSLLVSTTHPHFSTDKIMNPEKLRGDYGKLMYLLQDANSPQVAELLEFSCVKPIKTVYEVLKAAGGLALLEDPLVATATSVIAPDGKSRATIQRESRAKQDALRQLRHKYGGGGGGGGGGQLSRDAIDECMHSIADENYLLYFDRDPVRPLAFFLMLARCSTACSPLILYLFPAHSST